MRILILFLLVTVGLIIIRCAEEAPECPPQNLNPSGKLIVKSNPSGANIYLLGTDTGKNTPDSIDNLQPGTYDAFLYLQYYDTAYFTAQIYSNLTTSKEITLNPLPINTGKLVVKSNPSGARIYLLGMDTGKNTPDSIDNLQPGTYDAFLYLQYYDTVYFTAQIYSNLTTTKEITLVDGLPFVDIVLDYINAFSGDSVKFSWLLNQDVLMDSIIVERPITTAGNYVTDRYIYNKELFVWNDQFGNPIKYFLPPPYAGQNYYPRVEGFTYWFNFYGQKAHGDMTSFHLFFSQEM